MSRVVSAPPIEGLAFDTGSDALHAIQDHALSTGKSVRIDRASGSDRRIVCSSKEACGFFVQVYRQRHADKSYGKWYIASLQLEHSALCNAELKITTRQIADLPAFADAVQRNPKANIEALLTLVQERYGLSLSKQKRLVYRARDIVKQGRKTAPSNLVDSEHSPLPPRQFIRRRGRGGQKSAEDETEKKAPERMVWLDVFVETLLKERVTKYGQEFAQPKQQSWKRDMWEDIQQVFNATHNMSVTVDQLRIKFRMLQEQYARTRTQEEEASRDPATVVVYPRGWDIMVRYFGGENHSLVEEIESSVGDGQEAGLSNEEEDLLVLRSDEHEQGSSLIRPQPSPKRRRANPPTNGSDSVQGQCVALSSGVHERLDSIQNMQREMIQSMNGMQQAVQQSTDAIRDLQSALNQSNQVSAALLQFLQRGSHP